MGFLDKEAYERKNEWAARKMEEQKKKCNTLTEEQHDVLSWLCTIRHEMHCNQKDFFLSESSDHKKYWDYIMDEINEELKRVGFRTINFGNPEFVPTDYDYEMDGLTYEEAEKECYEATSEYNRLIEEFLGEIDSEHGTKYRPGGYGRLY